MGRRALVLAAATMMLALVAASGVAFAAVVSNGGFEAGDLSGWTVANQQPAMDQPDDEGSWFAYRGTASPLTGSDIAAPPRGNFAATTAQYGPGSHVLYKDIKLGRGMKHTLSFYLYYRNHADSFATPKTLNFNTEPNQQYRVDIMKPSAGTFSVGRADVLANVFRTEKGDRLKLAPTRFTYNLTPFAGKTVRLRFAEVDNRNNFLASVDAVKVKSTSK